MEFDPQKLACLLWSFLKIDISQINSEIEEKNGIFRESLPKKKKKKKKLKSSVAIFLNGQLFQYAMKLW